MPSWNGTFLGTFDSSIILSEKRMKPHRYVLLRVKEETFLAVMQKSKQPSLTNLIDELKTLFHLPKIGTHRIIIGSTLYLLSKPLLSKEGEILESPSLKGVDFATIPAFFKEQIQNIFVFRDILGLSRT